METPLIEFRDVTKRFGEQTVLDEVNVKIYPNQITTILGKSGTGKSVFLKHIIGLLEPDGGTILFDGRALQEMKKKDLVAQRSRMSYMFQNNALFDSMTVFENVAFPLRHHTRKKDKEIEEIVERKLRQVGMPGIGAKMPAELSGGMRKRVGLARALALDPEIVLFDEPTSGLDPVMADTVDKLIKQTQQDLGITFIVISHDIPSTFQIAHNIGMLYQGRLIEYGPKDQIQNSKNPILRQFFSRQAEGPMQLV